MRSRWFHFCSGQFCEKSTFATLLMDWSCADSKRYGPWRMIRMNLEHYHLSRTTFCEKESPWKWAAKKCFSPCWYASQVVTWGDEMYGGNCRALKDQLKDVQGIQVSRLGTDHFESKVRCFFSDSKACCIWSTNGDIIDMVNIMAIILMISIMLDNGWWFGTLCNIFANI